MFSLHTNGPTLAWKSVQSAINKCIKNGLVNTSKLAVDGNPGNMTFGALKAVTAAVDSNPYGGLLFESYLLLEMSRQYEILAVANPDKYLRYLNGWNNRLAVLSEI